MKTTKLSKNFAALCLSVAAFCAAQSGFAEVVVPEWQNSFDGNAPANNVAFYLYHVDSDRFTTNQLPFVDAKDATPWKNDDKFYNLKNGQKNYWQVESIGFNTKKSDQPVKYQKDPNGDKWCLYFQYSYNVIRTAYPVLYGDNGKLNSTSRPNSLNPAYEWYLISESQWKNHIAIADAKILVDEANGLLEDAVEGEIKQVLQTAVDDTEAAVVAVNNIESDASATINEKVAALDQALKDYKEANAAQMLQVLGNAISDARGFSPMFTFLDTAINEADAVYTKEGATPDELDAANKALAVVVKQAQAILESDKYKVYLSYLSNIDANLAKAAEYTEYSCDQLSTTKSDAETALLGISDANGLTSINDDLKDALKTPNADLARYGAAEDLVKHAAAVGYNEADGLAAVKASTLDGLPALMVSIRDAAIANMPADFFETHTENVDLTIFINNNSFELGNADGWTISNKDGDTGVKLANPDYLSNGIDGGFLFNTYKSNSTPSYIQGYEIYQTVTGLPNGSYRLDALLTSDAGNTTFLTVNRDRVGEGVSSPNGKNEFVSASYVFNVDNGSVTIGAIGEDKEAWIVVNIPYTTWYRADNFRLTLLSTSLQEYQDTESYEYVAGNQPRVKVNREIKPGQWTTLCLPMDCDIPDYMTLYEVKSEIQEGEHVSIEVASSDDEKILAGKPYIVNYPKSHKETTDYISIPYDVNNPTIKEFNANNVTLVAEPQAVGTYVPFTGLFEPTNLSAGDIYVSTSTDASAAAVYKELSADASNKQMKGFRAYFKVTDGASSNVRFITDEVITSIMQAIEDQQVANGTYDLSGRKAATLQKGTYVIDGKKVIIK